MTINIKFREASWPFVLAVLGVAGFVATHSLPGTGALRTIFLLFCVVYLASRWRGSGPTMLIDRDGRFLAIALVALTAWMGGRSLLLTFDGSNYLEPFLRGWTKLLAVGWLSAAMAFKSPRHEAQRLFYALFVGLFIHALAALAYIPWGFYTQHRLVRTLSLFGNYGYVSPLVDAALAMLMADIAQRLIHRKRLLPFGGRWIAVLLLLTLAASIILSAKSSALVTLLLAGSFVFVIAAHPSPYRKVAIATTLVVLVIAGIVSIQMENRWKNVSESIHYAMDVDANRDWVKGGYTENRPDIDGSFYLRAAWLNIALQGIRDNPWGMGYGSDAFGRYVQARFGEPNFIISHSGWGDFALANGLPGLLLLLVVGVCLILRGWHAFERGDQLSGLALPLLTLAFYFRGLLDGHFSAARMAGFVLMAGLLWGMQQRPDACRGATVNEP